MRVELEIKLAMYLGAKGDAQPIIESINTALQGCQLDVGTAEIIRNGAVIEEYTATGNTGLRRINKGGGNETAKVC